MIFSKFNCEFEVEKNKVYNLPTNLKEIERYGFYLIISVDNGNWLILENDIQRKIFWKLANKVSVTEVVDEYYRNKEDVNDVIVQIEGHNFEMIYTPEEYEKDFTLRIYLTNKCNLKCKHCFMYASSAFKNELSQEEICTLIKESNKRGAKKIILTGGEVVTAETFKTALKEAKKYDMYTQVLTNGTLWTDDLIDELFTYIDEVQISIDGYNEKSNAEIRGNGWFKKSLLCVDKFVKKKIFTSVIITPLYDSVEKYHDEYINFGKMLVEKYKNDDFLVIFASEIIDGREIKADKEKNNRYKVLIDEICENIYENNELTTFVMNHSNNTIFRNCGYGNLTVLANGDICFCGRGFDVRKYGNVRNMTFDEIMELRKRARKITQIDNISGCNTCDLKYICGGGCRLHNFPALTEIDLPQNVECNELKALHCNDEYKEKMYRLMIESANFLIVS